MNARHQPLSVNDLLPRGPLRRLGGRAHMHDTIDSTNAFLLREAQTAGDGAVAHAELQTAGRGRLGRRWEAPRGSSVTLSVLLLEPDNSPLLALGSLLGALAACEAIEASTDCAPAVRWPNDVVIGGRKLGGVLTESCVVPASGRAAPGARRAVVIGVGINCLQQRGHFKGDLARTATSLECESHHPVPRGTVAAGLLERLDHWINIGPQPDGWRQMRLDWRQRCNDFGTQVRLEQDARVFAGTVLEVDEQGDLVVELHQGGRRHFASTTTTRLW
jgi:BirA family biotin operon repressor/biotin-[acetyl-CoA-carboxylase] ligase